MKKTILAALFAAASAGVAAASQIDNESIYAALNVSETKTTDVDSVTYTKSVGGLECARNVHNAGVLHHSCTLDFAQADAGAIYDALNVPEQTVAATRLEMKHRKEVDALTCTRTHSIRSGGHMDIMTYACELKIK